MVIAGSIGIVIVIIIISLYNNQEPKIIEIDEPIEINEPTGFEINFTDSVIPGILDIEKKLDEIERKAAENYYEVSPIEWNKRGPFEIDRSEYRLGQKIFIRIGELDANEKGEIAFLRTLNETHIVVWQTIPFDGMGKQAFNFYTQPVLSKVLDICTVDDIIGEWIIVFRGTDYPNFKFEIIDKFIPGEEDSYEPIC
jgi:hypothetical protein